MEKERNGDYSSSRILNAFLNWSVFLAYHAALEERNQRLSSRFDKGSAAHFPVADVVESARARLEQSKHRQAYQDGEQHFCKLYRTI